MAKYKLPTKSENWDMGHLCYPELGVEKWLAALEQLPEVQIQDPMFQPAAATIAAIELRRSEVRLLEQQLYRQMAELSKTINRQWKGPEIQACAASIDFAKYTESVNTRKARKGR